MSWFRLNDDAAHDSKWTTIATEHPRQYANCWALWTHAGLHCARFHTDGKIPTDMLYRVTPLTRRAVDKALAILTQAGLLTLDAPKVATIPNFLKYNKSRATWLAEKEATQERVANFRKRSVRAEPLLQPLPQSSFGDFDAESYAKLQNETERNQASSSDVTLLLDSPRSTTKTPNRSPLRASTFTYLPSSASSGPNPPQAGPSTQLCRRDLPWSKYLANG